MTYSSIWKDLTLKQITEDYRNQMSIFKWLNHIFCKSKSKNAVFAPKYANRLDDIPECFPAWEYIIPLKGNAYIISPSV